VNETDHRDQDLLRRLSSDLETQLRQKEAERDSHQMGRPEWFDLTEQTNTLRNVLYDLNHALEHGFTPLEDQRAAAIGTLPAYETRLLERLNAELDGQRTRRLTVQRRLEAGSSDHRRVQQEIDTLHRVLRQLRYALDHGTTQPNTGEEMTGETPAPDRTLLA